MAAFDLTQIPSQKGRVGIVTGANIGLGYETALAFAEKDMTVILACRNAKKANDAKAKIIEQYPKAKVDYINLDLGRLASVRKFAKEVLVKYNRIDLLVNNAGIMVPPFSLTEDGFESQMGVNYFGHFLLTALLYPTIKQTKGSRIVSLSSIAHRSGKINFDDLQSRKSYNATVAYSQSKLACLMFAYELDRRIKRAGGQVLSVASHPGISTTNLAQHMPNWVQKYLFPILAPLIAQSPNAGAEPTLYAALGNDVKGGDYFGPNGFREMRGRAIKVDSTSRSKDLDVAKRLWEVSEKLTKTSFPL